MGLCAQRNAAQNPPDVGVAGAQCCNGKAGAYARHPPADAKSDRADDRLTVPFGSTGVLRMGSHYE